MSEAQKSGADAAQYDAIVVGAGVAGIYQVYRLREAGFSVLGIETASDVGGTWYWNRYPGCRFDSESYTYAYSFSEELMQEWNWSEHFARQPETLAYLNHVADKFDLRKNFQFNSRVKAAIFDEETDHWDVETEGGDKYRARFLILATGVLSATQFPNIEGMDSFKGTSFHTSQFPHDPNGGLGGDTSVYEGKRVGIIGTGATAVQLIPYLGEGAKELYVFQRTANWCSPLFNTPITDEEQPALKARYPEIFATCDRTSGAFIHEFDKRSIYDVTDEEREEQFERLYKERGFAIWLANFPDIMTDLKANAMLSEFMAKKIRARLDDPAVADLLVPTTHGFGQRRVPMETNYYETYNRDNVTLVDVRTNPIEKITPTGIKTTADEYELDVIIYATGFDAGSGAISRIDVRGEGGQTIQEKWADELKTSMGVQVAGFPNMFMHDGPHAAFCNIPRCVEVTVDWVSNLIEYMKKEQLSHVATTEKTEREWVDHATAEADKSLLSKTNSWIMGDNIEGKPRGLLLYAGPAPQYRQILKDVADSGYKGMDIS